MAKNEHEKFKEALKECREAFSDFTEKDWNEFEKTCRIAWKQKAL